MKTLKRMATTWSCWLKYNPFPSGGGQPEFKTMKKYPTLFETLQTQGIVFYLNHNGQEGNVTFSDGKYYFHPEYSARYQITESEAKEVCTLIPETV
jgi:hypothetical protein